LLLGFYNYIILRMFSLHILTSLFIFMISRFYILTLTILTDKEKKYRNFIINIRGVRQLKITLKTFWFADQLFFAYNRELDQVYKKSE